MIKMIFLIGIALSVGLYIWYVFYTQTKTIHKYILVSLVAVLIATYTYLQNQEENDIHNILIRFHNDKPIKCQGIDITKEHFNLVTGTNTFVGKLSSPYKAHVIPLEKCNLEPRDTE